MLAGTSISLIVGGSIAAYKSAEIVRELVKRGVKVRVVMTKAAAQFITPLTMQTLSGNVVTTGLFDLSREAEISHISLADSADLVLVAPATADLIAKTALGLADDAASTVLLATRAPIVIAPAMNVNMWQNAITRRNVQTLTEAGARFVEPEEGDLACGWVGPGRLAPVESIIETLEQALHPQDLKNFRVVVTAGPTREPLDPVRFLSNRSSGRMGYALAKIARYRGAAVTLISGPSAIPPPHGVRLVPVTTAEEMRQAVLASVSETGGASSTGTQVQLVFMAAAIADHRPAALSATKLKISKSSGYSLKLEPAPDVLKELADKRPELEAASGTRIKLIGFALETPRDELELLENARAKLLDKGADLLVGNSADSLGVETSQVVLVSCSGREEAVAAADKLHIAERIVQAALQLL